MQPVELPAGQSERAGADLPLVSAVIPTYNGSRWVEEAIESVLAQTYPSVEAVVVDDHSTDGTPAILERYRDRCRVLATPARAGHPAVGRNLGWRAASGTWIGLLDHDDIWLPGKTERQMAAARAEPETRVWNASGWLLRDGGGDARRLDRLAPLLRGRAGPTSVTGSAFRLSCVLLRRDLLEEIGGFDETYWAADDVALLLELARRGERVGAVDEPLVRLRVHEHQTSRRRLELLPELYRLLDGFAQANPAFRDAVGQAAHEVALGLAHELAGRNPPAEALAWYARAGDARRWPRYDRAAHALLRGPVPGLWPLARWLAAVRRGSRRART